MSRLQLIIIGVVSVVVVAAGGVYFENRQEDQAAQEQPQERVQETEPSESPEAGEEIGTEEMTEEQMAVEEQQEQQTEPPPPPPAQPPPPPPPAEPPPPPPPPSDPPPPPPPPPAQEVSRTVEADDNGLYPGSISVPQGATVHLTFKVRSDNVYFGGLDFRSSKFTTESVPPGGQTTVTFTADNTFTYSSYWPDSNTKKADGTIAVE